MMQQYAEVLKRAARFNDVWNPTKLYTQALDASGAYRTDERGGILCTLTAETFGFLDRIKDDSPEILGPTYTGESLLTVIATVETDNGYRHRTRWRVLRCHPHQVRRRSRPVRFKANTLEASEISPMVTE